MRVDRVNSMLENAEIGAWEVGAKVVCHALCSFFSPCVPSTRVVSQSDWSGFATMETLVRLGP